MKAKRHSFFWQCAVVGLLVLSMLPGVYGQGFGAVGEGTLQYQWQLNGTNLTGATGATLTLTNAQVEHIGAYRVGVSNAAGVTFSSVAPLNLLPTILTQPASQSVTNGGSVAFAVTATGTPELKYQWWFNSSPIPGATFSTFTNQTVGFTNAGDYVVVATNSFGRTSSVATLTVYIPVSGLIREGAEGLPNALVTVRNGNTTGLSSIYREFLLDDLF